MLSAVPTNLDDPPATRAALFDKIRAGIYIFFLVTGLFLVFNNSVFLYFFKPVTKGLGRIAVMRSHEGSVTRRTVLDSLWLPMAYESSVYNADELETAGDAEAQIYFPNQTRVLIKENSKVRITLVDQKINFRLATGEIEITSLIDQIISIQRGSHIEELIIHKGTYNIKIDSLFGVQLAANTQADKNVKSKKPKNEPPPEKKEEGKANEAKTENTKPPDDDLIANNSTTAPPEPLISKIRFALPAPKDETVFLGFAKQEIIVAARRTCPDLCVLKIYKDHKLWKTAEFKTEEESVVRLQPQELGVGLYDWIFASETVEFRSRFVIKNFSDEALARALEDGLPVEIQ